MIVKIFQEFWSIIDAKNNGDFLFIFGDNDKKIGKKGQAIIRDEINAYGIPTKKYAMRRTILIMN
jgi:hypothetical protein